MHLEYLSNINHDERECSKIIICDGFLLQPFGVKPSMGPLVNPVMCPLVSPHILFGLRGVFEYSVGNMFSDGYLVCMKYVPTCRQRIERACDAQQ